MIIFCPDDNTQLGQEASSFADLKKHVARDLDQAKPGEFQSRVGGSHTARGNWTPPALSVLVPGGGKLLGVSLVWQKTANSFQGYYQGAEPRASTSARYGGPRTPSSPTLALDSSRHLTRTGKTARPFGTGSLAVGWERTGIRCSGGLVFASSPSRPLSEGFKSVSVSARLPKDHVVSWLWRRHKELAPSDSTPPPSLEQVERAFRMAEAAASEVAVAGASGGGLPSDLSGAASSSAAAAAAFPKPAPKPKVIGRGRGRGRKS